MESEGWVKLHRKITRWEWWTDPNTSHLFIHLLLQANHEERRWRGILVRRGQAICGRNSLAKETGLSPMSVRTCLGRLKSTNEITIESTKQFSVITICKWDDYQRQDSKSNQGNGQGSNQQLANCQPSSNQRLTTNKNEKKGRREELKNEPSLLADQPNAEPPSDFSRLCRAFTEAFEVRFGTKYLFQGARDGKAAKELLAMGLTVEQIMDTVKRAWARSDGYWGPKVSSLGFLFAKWNEVSAEGNAGRKIEPPSKPFTLDPEPQKSEAQINAEIVARMEQTFAGMKIERRK